MSVGGRPWLPKEVRDWADNPTLTVSNVGYAPIQVDVDIVRRLCDLPMKGVWGEIKSRSSDRTEGFRFIAAVLHARRPQAPQTTPRKRRRDIEEFVSLIGRIKALLIAHGLDPSMRRTSFFLPLETLNSSVRVRRRGLGKSELDLRTLAEHDDDFLRLPRLGDSPTSGGSVIPGFLDELARVFESYIRESSLTSKVQGGGTPRVYFIRAVVTYFYKYLHAQLHESAATVASVVLEDPEIDTSVIRNALRRWQPTQGPD